MENDVLLKNNSLRTLRNILTQNFTYYHLNSKRRTVKYQNQSINFSRNTGNYILNSFRKLMKIIDTTGNFLTTSSCLVRKVAERKLYAKNG